MELVKVIFKLISDIQWFVFGIVMLIVFRKSMLRLLGGRLILNYGEKRFELEPPSQEITTAKNMPLDEIKKEDINKQIEELKNLENSLSHEVEANLVSSLPFLTNTQNKEMILMGKLVAVSVANYQAAMLYNNMFGSQIEYLRHLFSRSEADVEAAKGYYSNAARHFANVFKNITFEQWINYLIQNKLISVNGDKYSITLKGSDYIKYLNKQNLGPKMF